MKRVMVSGHFNPLHGGHLDMIDAAAAMGDYLIVIVSNDHAQLQKKGVIILDEQNRLRLVSSLRKVDEAILSVGTIATDAETLRLLAQKYQNDELVYANGGDRDSIDTLPEADICRKCNIAMVFGVGGDTKYDSSSRINQALGFNSSR